jgi:hypothetical protein
MDCRIDLPPLDQSQRRSATYPRASGAVRCILIPLDTGNRVERDHDHRIR